jgi:hypothetical protein
VANNLNINDKVYVPSSRISELNNHPVALYKTTVVDSANCKVKVSLPKGGVTGWIGAGLVHRDVGVLIITIGDYETETGLLDPLAKSVLQFCRLLVPDDQVWAFKLRGINELKIFWSRDQAAYSHVVLIAHGRQDGIKFGG